MVACPKCGIEYNPGKRFCRKCGSFLLSTEEKPFQMEDRGSTDHASRKQELICPKCLTLHPLGNYCRRCGSLLAHRIPSETPGGQPLEKKSIKKWSKQWLKLSEEKKNLETCLGKLEAQREKVSADVLGPTLTRYESQLGSLSHLAQEIEAQLLSVREKTSEAMNLLEKELDPLRKRLAEVRSLYQLGALTKTDFLRQQNVMAREIRSREKSLRKHRQALSILPDRFGGKMVSYRMAGHFLRPFPLMAVFGVVLLIGAGAYMIWRNPPSFGTGIPKESVPSSSISPLQPKAPEGEAIKSVFENIRQANLRKDIDLFMSCYAHNFKEKKEKRLSTLETWKNFDYVTLTYDLKKQVISGHTATVTVEWLIRTSAKADGHPRETRALLDVTLTKEDGDWKIREIRPTS